MLWTVFVVVLVSWLLGFSFHLGGGLIHLWPVVALIVLVFNLLSGRSRAVLRTALVLRVCRWFAISPGRFTCRQERRVLIGEPQDEVNGLSLTPVGQLDST